MCAGASRGDERSERATVRELERAVKNVNAGGNLDHMAIVLSYGEASNVEVETSVPPLEPGFFVIATGSSPETRSLNHLNSGSSSGTRVPIKSNNSGSREETRVNFIATSVPNIGTDMLFI